MKESAVQYLEKYIRDGNAITIVIIELAKYMEKQQIVNAYEDGIEEGIMRYSSEEYNLEYYQTAEKYYNETFKLK